MRTMDAAEVLAFLRDGARTAAFATVGADGAPHVVPVWYLVEDGVDSPGGADGPALVVTTASRTAKGRHLARDPRVAISVDDDRPPYAFVTVRGRARVQRVPDDLPVEEFLTWTTRMAGRYLGAEQAAAAGQGLATIDDLLVRVPLADALGAADLAGDTG